jgi:hypothetical protein
MEDQKMLTETTTQSAQINSHNPKPNPKASLMLERNIIDDTQAHRRSGAGTNPLEEASNHVSMKTDPVNRGAAACHQSNTRPADYHNSSPVDVCQSRAE